MSTEPGNVFRFGRFTLDLHRGTLRAGEQELELRPQSFLVLRILVENHGRLVSKDRLHEQVWKGTVVTDDSLMHCIADVRKVLGDSDRKLIRTMPRRGYMLDTSVETGDCVGPDNQPALRSISAVRIAIGLAAVAAVAIVVTIAIAPGRLDSVADIPTFDPPGNSIAVLPFIDLSEKQNLRYFGESISEEIIALLSQSTRLHVIARTSSFSFRGDQSDVGTIAQRLNSRYVLEGSVRYVGDTIRAIAQLIDTTSDNHVWSKTFDLPADGVVDIQSGIALAVASELRVELDVSEPLSRSTDANTFGLFSHARHLINIGQPDQLPTAIDLLKQALERDPEFVRGITELGRAYYNQRDTEQATWEEALDNAFPETDRALELAPDDAVANAWTGWRVMFHYRNYAEAARRYRRAFASEPRNVDIIRGFVLVLLTVGRLEDAVAFADFLVAHDPLCTICQNNRNQAYIFAGRYQEAEQHTRTLVSLYPETMSYAVALAEALLLEGRHQEALTVLENQNTEAGGVLALTSIAYQRMGRTSEHEAILAALIDRDRQLRLDSAATTRNSISLAVAYAATGNDDAAFYWLEQYYRDTRFFGPDFRHPLFEPLRNDDRWRAFLERNALTNELFERFDLLVDVPY